ncbi:hypothetical protein L8P91_20325 [Enterobacter bugandensis]|uniref:hypothetical protein n=1 Tax=Enterobacter TaxID=547 RepID=UPI001D005718|nr:hypothetical protein [Enterobacter bugandensis]MCE1394359.1 hypothetical protein [Enterobacter bugandensis]MCK7068493.1 hypothetical protein [Enterobacter bugandensis]MCK7133700.1 hypothetical protein [Enterobacter bugandensis]
MDTMNIGLTEILSFAALIVSALSMLYAKKQSDFAKKDHFNDYRSHLSQSHLKYRSALTETQKKHKNDLIKLSRLAGETLIRIVNHFDQYDTNQHAERYLRHLLHESSEMVFRTFQGQLAWQTSENISHRFYQISFLEDNLNPIKNIFGDRSFRKKIHSKYDLDPNAYLEADLLNDTYFCNLVLEMKARVDQSKLQELMSNVQKEMINFNMLHNNLKADLSISANYLDDLILQGNKEHFQLRESPQLYSEIKRTKTQLKTLSYINIPEDLDKSFSGRNYFSISKSIYLCALLHAIQCLHSWGWDYEQ